MNTLAIEPITLKDKLALIKVITNYALEYSDGNWITGDFYNCRLSSVFQPVFSPIKGKIIGHGAYIRSESNGKSHYRLARFSYSIKRHNLVELSHLC